MTEAAMNRAIFLDRDGTLVRSFANRPANDASEIELLPGVVEGLRLLREARYLLIVATNQGGIALGFTTPQKVIESYWRMQDMTGSTLQGLYYCPHHPNAGCVCRKPKPGLLLRAAEDWLIDLSQSQMIGDGGSDMRAAVNAGLMRRWLVRSDFTKPEDEALADGVFDDFLSAARAAALAE